MAKEPKTSEELIKLLQERIEPYELGRTVNPQWIRIVDADPGKEGANWKITHSGTPGEFADAIEREMPELQKLYDLKS